MTNLTKGKSGGCGALPNLYDKKRLYELLPRHTKFSPKMLQKLQHLPPTVLENRADPLAIKAYRMAREVMKDFDRARQFTRTQLNAHGILYGIVVLKHSTKDMVLNYFQERFPAFIIALFNQNTRETYIRYPNGKEEIRFGMLQEVVAKLSENVPKNPLFASLESTSSDKDLFAEFYKSQFIQERENRNYFHHMIPKECLTWPGMETERRFRNNSLDQFLISSKTTEKPKKNT